MCFLRRDICLGGRRRTQRIKTQATHTAASTITSLVFRLPSLNMASPQPPKRRVRNESQLQQKRLADRTKHRENRKANKQSMQRVEHEIATIRRDLQALFSHIRTLQTVPTPLQPAIAYPVAIQDASRQLVPLGHPGHRIEDCQLQYGYSYAIQSQGFEGMPSPLTDATNPAVHISKHDQYGASGQVFDCHCGTRHSDLFGHIDHCVVTKLYKGRTTSRHDADALGDMPRNPSLSAMLLQSGNENTATFFITGFLKACPVKSVEQLLAFYLIAYRYMRVRKTPVFPRHWPLVALAMGNIS